MPQKATPTTTPRTCTTSSQYSREEPTTSRRSARLSKPTVVNITPSRRHRPLQPARAMSRVTTKVTTADATAPAPARVLRRTRSAARIGRRVQAKPRDRATATTRTTDRTTTTGRTQPKAPLTDRRATDQAVATDQPVATAAVATTDRAAAPTADGRLWMNRCTTGGELANTGDNSPSSVDRKESEKFFRPKACGSFPGPLEISQSPIKAAVPEGSGARSRGKVAGNRRQLPQTDPAHQIERNDEGQPESSRSQLSFWVRSLKTMQSAGRLGFGTV